MKNFVFIGAGSGNIFSVLYLLKNNIKGEEILIIDKGLPPSQRDVGGKESLLFGFAGAGLKSDGKMVFSSHLDRTVTSLSDRFLCHKEIMSHVREFTKGLDIGVSKKNDEVIKGDSHIKSVRTFLKEGVDLLQSDVVHIGTGNNVIFGERMYRHMVNNGVQFMWNTSVVDVDMRCNVIYSNTINGKTIKINSAISFGWAQVSLGKTGVSWMKDFMYRNKLNYKSSALNIGGRMEFQMSDSVSEFVKEVQYDYKFFVKTEDNSVKSSVRTFCTNNSSAYVIKELITNPKTQQEVTTFNGHAFGLDKSKINGLSNTAIITRIEGLDTARLQSEFLSAFEKTSESGAFIKGNRFSGFQTTLELSDMTEMSWSQYLNMMPTEISKSVSHMKSFVETIDKIFDLDGDYIIYVPEIKMASDFLDTDYWYRVRGTKTSFVGDCTSGSVGIVPSAVTGLMATMKNLEEYTSKVG